MALPLEIPTLYRKEIGGSAVRKILLLSILFSASTMVFIPNVWGADAKPVVPGVSSDESCISAFNQAKTVCVADSSPTVQSAMGILSKVAAAGSAGISIFDACSKFKSALNTANEALTAYNTACAAMQYRCKSTCTKNATTASDQAKQLRSQAATAPAAAAALELKASIQDEIAQGDTTSAGTCQTEFSKNMKDAAMGIGAVIASSALSKSCEDKTTDTAATCKATAADGTVNSLCINGVDCSLSTNASNPTCICNSSPNASGCPGATDYGSSYGAPNYGTSGDNSTSQTTVLPPVTAAGKSGLDATTRNAAAIPPAASANGGGSGGGGAVAGDGMSAAADSKKSATVDKKNSLNPNILSGYDGGGGGGGSRGGSVSGSSAYGAYMPGATKDPSRALASQARAGGQVTSAGSKSNWEKINERYMENKSTLMGE